MRLNFLGYKVELTQGYAKQKLGDFFSSIKQWDKKQVAVVLLLMMFGMGVRLANYESTKYPIQELDPHFHARVTKYVILYGGFVPARDPQGFYSSDIDIPVEIHAFLVAIVYLILTMFAPFNDLTFYQIYSFYPVVAGGLTCAAGYLLMRELVDEKAGIVSGIALAVMPSLVYKGSFGVGEEDPFAMLMLILIIYAYARALSRNRIFDSLLAGFVFGLGYASWTGMAYALYVVTGALFLQAVLNYVRKDPNDAVMKTSVFSSISLAVTLAFFNLFSTLTGTAQFTAISWNLNVFAPGFVFGAYFFAACLEYYRSRDEKYKKPIAAGFLVVFLLYVLKGPSLFLAPFENIENIRVSGRERVASMRDVIMQTIGEQTGGADLTQMGGHYNIAFWVFLFGLVLVMPYRLFREKSNDMLLIVLGASTLFMARYRTAYLFLLAVSVGLIFGLTVSYFAKLFSKTSLSQKRLAGVFMFTLVLTQMIAGLEFTKFQGRSYLTENWLTALEWMKNETPEDASFMSWWDYGHWTTLLADRKALSDNRQMSRVWIIHNTAKFFTSIDEEEMLPFLEENQVDYVITDKEVIVGGFGSLTGGKRGALQIISNGWIRELENGSVEGTPDTFMKRDFSLPYILDEQGYARFPLSVNQYYSYAPFSCIKHEDSYKCKNDVRERLNVENFTLLLDSIEDVYSTPYMSVIRNKNAYYIVYTNHVTDGFCCKPLVSCPPEQSQYVVNQYRGVPSGYTCFVGGDLEHHRVFVDEEFSEYLNEPFPGKTVQFSEFGYESEGEYYVHFIRREPVYFTLGRGESATYNVLNQILVESVSPTSAEVKTGFSITGSGVVWDQATLSVGETRDFSVEFAGEEFETITLTLEKIVNNKAVLRLEKKYYDMYLETPGSTKEMMSRLYFNDTTLNHFELVYANPDIRIHKVIP